MSDNLPAPGGEFLLYATDDGRTRLSVRVQDGTVWLPQRLIAELFGVSVKTANEHVVNIYDEGELDPQATIRKFRIVQPEGTREVSRLVDHYKAGEPTSDFDRAVEVVRRLEVQQKAIPKKTTPKTPKRKKRRGDIP